MATDKDVLGKADALLRRHAAAAPGSGSDTGGVPVLTDLIDTPGQAAPSPNDELVREVAARVMTQVEGKLAPQVHAAVASAIVELRQELTNAIADAVEEALARRPVK